MKTLKQLLVSKDKIQKEISNIDITINEFNKKKVIKQKELNEIQQNINKMMPEIVITEHALLRYFQRVLGYDLEEIKNKILPDKAKEDISKLNTCEYPVEGFKLIVKNNVIVTIETKEDGREG
jgi:predicted RND superfamily exporter protein